MKKTIILLSILLIGNVNLRANSEKVKSFIVADETPIKGKYALVISFISIGGGIDGATYDKIMTYINNNPKKPAFATPARRGREGETTLFLKLNELSKAEKKTFIEDIEKMIAGTALVKIQKNVNIKSDK